VAHHHGFLLKRNLAYQASTKGKVESGFKYVTKNFWPRMRKFKSLVELNIQAQHWVDTYANERTRGITLEKPVDRWLK
jgi:transposase